MESAQASAPEKIKVVVTVHGIRTFGQWQERLGELLVAKNSSITVEHYHYGYFSVVAFLIPPLRWLVTLRFRRHVREVSARFPGAEISFVAHSFGTHLVGYGLYGLKASDKVNVGTVLLAGSVLRTSFPWGELINAARVKRVVNDCGINDNILLLSQFCVLFTGMAGRLGFRGMTGKSIVNRYFVGGHSHYFENEGGGESKFMVRYWLPILTDESPLVSHDERVVKGPLQGVVLTLIQIADPIKLLLYFGIVGGLVIYFYWIPKLETRESFSRAMQSDLERATAVARTYYETFNDLPRAIASLSSKLVLSDKAEVGAQRRILRYWFQSVRPIDDVLNEIDGGQIIRWSKNYYAVNKGVIKFLTRADVIAGVRIAGTDKVFLICSDNVARVVSMSSLNIEKEIVIPPPSESMDRQWDSAQFDFVEFQANVSGLIAAQLTSVFEREENSDGQSISNEEEGVTQEDIEASESVDEWLARLNDPVSQYKNVEVLNLDSLSYDESSGLVVGVGWVRSHSGSSTRLMQVFDPQSGAMAAAEYSSQFVSTSDNCGEFRLYDFRKDADLFDMNVRLRKPGETNFFHYYVTKHKERNFKAREDGCKGGLITDGLISSLKFPSVVSERDLWKRVSDEAALELAEDTESAQHYPQLESWPDTQPIVGEWHYFGLIENDAEEGTVRSFSEWGFEDRQANAVPWDQAVRWVHKSDGSKYGINHICRFRLGVAVACAYVRCMGNFCSEDFYQKSNLMAISSFKEFGNNSLYVLNLNSMQFMHLPETPDGGVESLLFNQYGVLSALTSQREIWLYSNFSGVPTAQSMLLVPPNSEYLEDSLYSIPKIGDDPIAVYADGRLGRIGRFTMSPIWISTRLPGSGRVHVQVSNAGGFLIMNNDTFFVLLDSETGISISRPLKVTDFSPEDNRGWGAEGISINIGKGDSIVVSVDDNAFVRAAPLSEKNLDERLQRIVQYIGFDHSANSISALPVSK